MEPVVEPESIRNLVLRTVSGWGVPDARLRTIRADDIVRQGTLIGRRYEIDGIRAIWLQDRDVIIFSGRNGRLLKTLSASEALSPDAKVA